MELQIRKFTLPKQKEIIEYLDNIEISGYYKKISNYNDKNICAIDQKTTYDLINVVAKCILEIRKEKEDFSINDFLSNEYSKEILKTKTQHNGKAIIRNETSKEYDKLFGNSLETLAYVEILEKKYIKKCRYFKVKKIKILETLANDEFACVALVSYLVYLLVKNDSLVIQSLTNLKFNEFNNNNKNLFKHSTIQWLQNNSNRQKDSSQIAKKIDNYLFYLFEFKKYKSNKNNKNILQGLSDLSYFRIHVRDKKKKYLLTRKENESRVETKQNFNYENIRKMIIDANKEYYETENETSEFSEEQLESSHCHHIYPCSFWQNNMINYELKIEPDMPENLIILSQNEHLNIAHPKNNTRQINEVKLPEILWKQYEKITKYISKNILVYDLKRFYYLLCLIFNIKCNHSYAWENDEIFIKAIEEILSDK